VCLCGDDVMIVVCVYVVMMSWLPCVCLCGDDVIVVMCVCLCGGVVMVVMCVSMW